RRKHDCEQHPGPEREGGAGDGEGLAGGGRSEDRGQDPSAECDGRRGGCAGEVTPPLQRPVRTDLLQVSPPRRWYMGSNRWVAIVTTIASAAACREPTTGPATPGAPAFDISGAAACPTGATFIVTDEASL